MFFYHLSYHLWALEISVLHDFLLLTLLFALVKYSNQAITIFGLYTTAIRRFDFHGFNSLRVFSTVHINYHSDSALVSILVNVLFWLQSQGLLNIILGLAIFLHLINPVRNFVDKRLFKGSRHTATGSREVLHINPLASVWVQRHIVNISW